MGTIMLLCANNFKVAQYPIILLHLALFYFTVLHSISEHSYSVNMSCYETYFAHNMLHIALLHRSQIQFAYFQGTAVLNSLVFVPEGLLTIINNHIFLFHLNTFQATKINGEL